MNISVVVSEAVDRARGIAPRYTLVSEEDGPLTARYRWNLGRGPNRYVTASKPRSDGFGVVYLHRLIMNAQPGQIVDHIDGDTTNNTRDNLQFVSHSQNMQKRRPAALWSKAKWHNIAPALP